MGSSGWSSAKKPRAFPSRVLIFAVSWSIRVIRNRSTNDRWCFESCCWLITGYLYNVVDGVLEKAVQRKSFPGAWWIGGFSMRYSRHPARVDLRDSCHSDVSPRHRSFRGGDRISAFEGCKLCDTRSSTRGI